jgi:chromosome segregation ATPase
MTTAEQFHDSISFDVENIGGISETTVELEPGVTILEGANATNRTSFFQAVMAAMGSDQFSLKGDAEAGRVELDLEQTTVERRFDRQNDRIASSGDRLLEDPEIADLFAFLLEENEARRAVARDDNLHEVLTRPIDTAEIEAEIERLQANKRNIDEQLEAIEEREQDLFDLEKRKEQLESGIEDRQARLEDRRAEIEAADTDLESEVAAKEEVEAQLEIMKDKRSELDDLKFRLETLRETVDSLESEREETKEELASLDVDPDMDEASLRSELDDLRERKRAVNTVMNQLQRIVQFNEDMLEGTDNEIANALRDDQDDDGPITDQLLESDETVSCWTCGSNVARGEIETALDSLRSLRQEKVNERKSIEEQIDETEGRVSELERAQRQRDSLEDRLAEIDAQIDQKRSHIRDLEDKREDLHAEIDDLEDAVEEEDDSFEFSEVLDLHKEANRVEIEIEQKESELASVESEMDEIESLVGDREDYEQRREQITEQLTELRNRMDRLEQNAVEEFNERMAEVLDILEYENIARVWIERRERETRKGRRKVSESYFDLHIVRVSESGEMYEDSVETLSESEREVVGLVFGLAGYLVHNLHEEIPVMLLDSMEAIDSYRIADLIEYFADYPDFLIVALLPEDAEAIDVEHETIAEI